MSTVPNLTGKKVAIVAMGKSHDQYIYSQLFSYSVDEVWAINAMSGIIFHDRVFMMDPASRFLDTDDAGSQTGIMKSILLGEHQVPIYTSQLDERCKGLVEYPLEEVVNSIKSTYLNNTAAYAVAFAYAANVSELYLYGLDYSYTNFSHFAESGRACTEHLLAKCANKGMKVVISGTSSLLDNNVSEEKKLYGYHRLKDPTVMKNEEGIFKKYKYSEIKDKIEKPNINNPVEPYKI
mgnify:FL=1